MMTNHDAGSVLYGFLVAHAAPKEILAALITLEQAASSLDMPIIQAQKNCGKSIFSLPKKA